MPNVGCVVRDFFNLKGWLPLSCLDQVCPWMYIRSIISGMKWNGVQAVYQIDQWHCLNRSGFYQHFEQHSSIISEDPVASMSRRCQMYVNSIWGHLRYLHCIFKLGYQCRHDVVLIDCLIDWSIHWLIDWLDRDLRRIGNISSSNIRAYIRIPVSFESVRCLVYMSRYWIL